MSVEQDIFSLLSNYAGLSALVSSRIYPIKAPQKPTYPLIVYSRISNNNLNALGGSCGIGNSRFQMKAYAETYSSASAVADQIQLAMDSATFNNLLISRIDLDFDDNAEKYSIVLDFSLWHN